MPPRKAATVAAPRVDDSDDDLADAPSGSSTIENKASPAKRKAGRPAKSVNKVTKRAPATTSAAKGKRAPLKDTTNLKDGNDTEEVDDFDDLQPQVKTEEVTVPPEKSSKSVAKAKATGPAPARNRKGAKAKTTELAEIPDTQPEAQPDMEEIEVEQEPKEKPPPKPRGRRPASQQPKQKAAQEPEEDPMDIDNAQFRKPEIPASRLASTSSSTHDQRRSESRRRSGSVTQYRRQASRIRGGSGSDNEAGDAVTRRKLTEMTRKFEALQVKYEELRDVGLQEADAKYDALRKANNDRARTADVLIASLREKLAQQTALSESASSVRSELDTLQARLQKSETDNKESLQRAESEAKSLKQSLQSAQTENKALQARLAATRSASAAQEGRVPGSAIKNSAIKGRGKDDAAAIEAQKRLLKEDLYGDLTGLLIRDVKRDEEAGEDIYDCMQTGRNGTLRFYLNVANPSINGKLPPGFSFDEAEFSYTPILDTQNDMDLISLLPDYLTEEICFTRQQAAKFYARICDCMNKKFEVMTPEQD